MHELVPGQAQEYRLEVLPPPPANARITGGSASTKKAFVPLSSGIANTCGGCPGRWVAGCSAARTSHCRVGTRTIGRGPGR